MDTDGRSARRHRNTDAVLDAVHALFVDGVLDPSLDDVAARSGVSLRSIYRYFPDRQRLVEAALQRRMQLADPLFHVPGLGEGSLDSRIATFATHRVDLYDLMAPTARAALAVAANAPVIATVVAHRKDQLTEQARRQFAPELATVPPQRGDDLLAAIDVLCQFESVDTLRHDRGLTRDDARRVLVGALSALLGIAAP